MRLRAELLASSAQDPLLCNVFDDSGHSDDSGGGGGDVTVYDDDPGDDPGDDQQPPAAQPDPLDLSSTDMAVLYHPQFPRNQKLSKDQIKAVMNYNPLDPAHRQAPAPAPAQPAAQPPAQRQPRTLPEGYRYTQNGQILGPDGRFVAAANVPWPRQRRQSRQPAAQPQPQPQPTTDQRLDTLIQTLNQTLAARPAATGAADPQSAPQPPKFMYGPQGLKPQGMVIPPAIFQLLESDDPNHRAQGVQALAVGVANTIVKDLIGMMGAMRNDIVDNHVPALLQQRHNAQSAREAFYGRYPALNRKELHVFINQISQTVGAEWKSQGYDYRDPNNPALPSVPFMDAVAQRYMTITGLGSLQAHGAAQPQVQNFQPPVGGQVVPHPSSFPQPSGNEPASQPYFPSPGARPPAATSASSKSEEIMTVVRSR